MARNFGRRRSSAKGETTDAEEMNDKGKSFMLISHQSFHYQAVNHGSVCPHAPCACGERARLHLCRLAAGASQNLDAPPHSWPVGSPGG